MSQHIHTDDPLYVDTTLRPTPAPRADRHAMDIMRQVIPEGRGGRVSQETLATLSDDDLEALDGALAKMLYLCRCDNDNGGILKHRANRERIQYNRYLRLGWRGYQADGDPEEWRRNQRTVS